MFREKLWLSAIIMIPISYLWLSAETIMIYVVLMTIDIITGVFASYFDDKKKIKSDTLMKWVIKKVSYFMIPFVIALVAKWLWDDTGMMLTPLVTTSISFLIAWEAYSIIGNIYNINTGKKVPEFDAMEAIMKKILSILKIGTDEKEKKIDELMKKYDELEKKK